MGLFFDVKQYAVHDGPGIRMSVFFKGCPLRCAWCHNPEGRLMQTQLLYDATKCLQCGLCEDRTQPQNCPTGALAVCGEEYTTDQIMSLIDRQSAFFDRSEGGVTFTGGEPLMQPDALKELLFACGERGYHCAVDTSLFAPPQLVSDIIPLTDLFLIDLKTIDSALHKRYTGVSNSLIVSNMRLVARSGVPFSLRIPYVGGVNVTPHETGRMVKFALQMRELGNLDTVHILPYHNYGRSKWTRLYPDADPLPPDPFTTPLPEQVEGFIEMLTRNGLYAVQG